MSAILDLSPGSVFAGDYRVVKPLRMGGMGALYVVEQISTMKQRALKLMQPQLIPDERTRQRFIQEARISAIIPSDHVVEVIAAGIDRDSNVPWIAMELLSGEDLADFAARRGVLTAEEVNAIFSELCHALGAAHGAGIVHRDLKPENVFLARGDGTERAKLLDFGIVKLADVSAAGPQRTQAGTLLGTPAYMSPEQARGEPLTPASDWYSLGLLLHTALTGGLPGHADPRTRPAPPPPAAASPALAALCVALLDPDPRARPDARAIARALARDLDDDVPADQVPLLGRGRELAALGELARRAPHEAAAILLEGRSGVGKSALLAAFLHTRSAAGELVLRARCYEHESVPYKAVDALVDALTTHLRSWPPADLAAILPADFAALTRVFPVLARLAAPAAPDPSPPPDPQELRRLAFRALRSLLAAVARTRPLVLAIDDLQWGDLDSARLLLALLAPPDPLPCLWIGTCRSEDRDASPFLAELENMEAGYKYLLFLRPRRMGKSLLVSMLEHYYDIGRKDRFDALFGGLWIHEHPTEERNAYLVLTLDFSTVNTSGGHETLQRTFFQCVQGRVRSLLSRHRHQHAALDDFHGRLGDYEDADALIAELMNVVSVTDHKLYLLIDEYDNFANRLTGNYARTSIDVKLRQSGQQDMISLAAINDQQPPQPAERRREHHLPRKGGAHRLGCHGLDPKPRRTSAGRRHMGRPKPTGNGRKYRQTRHVPKPGAGAGRRPESSSRPCAGHASRLVGQPQQPAGQSKLRIDFALVIATPANRYWWRQCHGLGPAYCSFDSGQLPADSGPPAFCLQPAQLGLAQRRFRIDCRRHGGSAGQIQHLDLGGDSLQGVGVPRAFVEQLQPMHA